MFARITERICSLLHYVGMWLIFLLLIVGIVGVISRFVGNPIGGMISLSMFILVGSIYLCLAYTQLRKGHVAVEFVVERMHMEHRSILGIISPFLSMAACSLLLWGSWPYALASLQLGECMDGAPYYPIWPTKLCIAIGVSILFLQTIADFVKAVAALRTKARGEDSGNFELSGS